MSSIEDTRAALRKMIDTDPVAPESKATILGPFMLHKKWREMVQAYEATDKRFVDVLTSPEAQDEDILLLCRARAKLRVQMGKTQELVYQFLMVKGSDDLADKVKSDLGGMRRQFKFDDLVRKPVKWSSLQF